MSDKKPEAKATEVAKSAPILEVKAPDGKTLLKVEAPAETPKAKVEVEPKVEEPAVKEPKVEEPKVEVKEPAKAEPKPPEEPVVKKLYLKETATYKAWVTKNGDSAWLANLTVRRTDGDSSYTYQCDTAEQGETLLVETVRNLKI